jgi:RHS repeat-associated protein
MKYLYILFFVVLIDSISTQAVNIPSLSSPANYSIYNRNNTSSIKIEWSNVSAGEYWLNVFPSGNAPHPKFDASVGNSLSKNIDITNFENGVYIFQVKARATGEAWSNYSTSREFIVDVPPSVPSLSSPADGASITQNSSQTFSWDSPNEPVVRYYIRIVNGVNFNASPIFENEPSLTSKNVNCNWSAGTYTWGVRAIKPTPSGYNQSTYETTIGWGKYAPTRTFSLIGQPPSIPLLKYPSNGVTLNDNTPDLTWTADNANYFHIQISNNSGFASIIQENVSCNGFNWTPNIMADGTYYWRVKTYGNGTWSNWSNPWNFTINTKPPSPPTLIAPSGNINLENEIIFSWRRVSNAARYRIKICSDQAMTSQITGSPFEAALGDTTYAISASYFSIGQTYYWQVGSISSNEGGGWGIYGSSPAFSFKPIQSHNFNLILPSPNTTITTQEMVFSWPVVSDAIKYELYVDNNEGLGSCEVAPKNIADLRNLTSTTFTLSGNWLNQNLYFCQVWAIRKSDTIKSNLRSFIYQPQKTSCPQWSPIYRLFKPSIVDHFYCTSPSHRDAAIAEGYKLEKEEGYISIVPFEVKSPDSIRCIYRFALQANNGLKTSCHYYTTNDKEIDNRIISGMIYEGIIGYTYKLYQAGLDTLWHVYLNQAIPDYRRDNLYTTSRYEANYAYDVFKYKGAGPEFMAYVSNYNRNANIPWISNNPEVGIGVNPVNGIFSHYEKNGFNIPGAKTSLNFDVAYSSSRAMLGDILINPLGIGWSHNYNNYIFTDDCWVYVCWGNGDIYKFYKNDFSPEIKITYDILSQPSSNSLQIRQKDQTLYLFEKLKSDDNIYFLTSIKDRNSNEIKLSYDNVNHRLLSVQSPEQRSLKFSYNDKGKLITVTDPTGRTIKFDYSTEGLDNLIKYTDAKNQETKYSYLVIEQDTLTLNSEFSHLLQTLKLPMGNTITNTYNTLAKPVRIKEQSYSLAGMSIKTQIGIPSNNSVSFIDGSNKAVSINFMPIDVTKNIFNVTQTSTSNTKYEYDINSYNPTLPKKIIDGNGNITTIVCDNLGNTIEIVQPNGIKHLFEYNQLNQIKKYTDPLVHIYSIDYDSKGNINFVVSPTGEKTDYTNNSNGTINTITNAGGVNQTFAYNSFGNVSGVTDKLGNSTSFGYDAISRLTSVTNPLGQSSKYTFDNNDLVTDVFDSGNNNTHYTFNANDLLTEVQNALLQKTSLTYDNYNQLTSIANPLNDKSLKTYYKNGLDSTYTTPNSDVFSYTYDDFYRLKGIIGPELNRTITYDLNDNVKSVSDQRGTVEFTYDELSRMLSSKYDNKEVKYSYDKAGNIISINYPGDKKVSYEYYEDNLLKSVTDWNAHKTSYYYRKDGSLDSINYANKTYCKYKYDEAGRLNTMYNFKSNVDTINYYNYQLDAIGNQTAVTQTEPFGIFPLQPDSVSYSYNAANRLVSAGKASFTFDENGNLKTQSENGTTNYNWDAEGRLTGISGKINANFTYDGLGNRRSSNINGVARKYILDLNSSMSQVLMETDANGNVMNYYIYGIGLVERIKADGSTTNYFHYDSRGSTIALTDQSKNITHKYNYGAFGELYQKFEPDSDPNPFRYIGQHGVMADDSVLYFMRARYYNPVLGRFISEDPVWNSNLYNYVNGNPIIMIDPNGELENNVCSIKVYRERKAMLLKQMLYYQQESAKYEQRDMRLERWQIALEGLSDVCITISATAFPFLPAINSTIGAIGNSATGDNIRALKYSTSIGLDLFTGGLGTKMAGLKGITNAKINISSTLVGVYKNRQIEKYWK